MCSAPKRSCAALRGSRLRPMRKSAFSSELPERAYPVLEHILKVAGRLTGGRYEILVGASVARYPPARASSIRPGDGAPDPYTGPCVRAVPPLPAVQSGARTNALPHCSAASCRRGCGTGMLPLEFNSALVQGAYRPGIGRLLYTALLRLVLRLLPHDRAAPRAQTTPSLP